MLCCTRETPRFKSTRMTANVRSYKAPARRSTPWRDRYRTPAPDFPARRPKPRGRARRRAAAAPSRHSRMRLLWPMAGADVAQHFGGIAQGHAVVDVTRVRPMILGAVQRKSDVRADWSAEKYQHAIAQRHQRRARQGQ